MHQIRGAGSKQVYNNIMTLSWHRVNFVQGFHIERGNVIRYEMENIDRDIDRRKHGCG